MFIIYDQSFNANEWFIILLLIFDLILIWKLPKRFPVKESLIYLTYFIFIGIIFDHTISIQPFDYYDVNDDSAYGLMDFLSYLTYGPFGYCFLYFYDLAKIKKTYDPIYIFIWALIAIGTEYFAHSIGVFHYKNGYKINYSFLIYLIVLTSNLYFYKLLKKTKTNS